MKNCSRNIRPEDCYDTIINPELLGHSTFKIKGSEECPTIEGLKFKVWVPLSNQMKFVKYVEKF
jgi:peptide deformylase